MVISPKKKNMTEEEFLDFMSKTFCEKMMFGTRNVIMRIIQFLAIISTLTMFVSRMVNGNFEGARVSMIEFLIGLLISLMIERKLINSIFDWIDIAGIFNDQPEWDSDCKGIQEMVDEYISKAISILCPIIIVISLIHIFL